VIRLWGRLNSINVQKAAWILDELDLAWEHVPAGGDSGRVDTPEFRAMNPHGKVPVLEDEGVAIWESNAIVRYLAARYAQGVLWPLRPAARALVDQWMDWAATTLQPCQMEHFWGWWRTPEAQRDLGFTERLWRMTGDEWRRLDAVLAERPFVAGDRITMADIPAGTLVYRYFTLPLERPELPNVLGWYGRLCSRPAYQRNVMRPYDDLLGRLKP